MRIGIIGAGFTGLTAALELQKMGHTVVVFEKEAIPGGLAMGFKDRSWEWSLEKHYHHIFTSDSAIRNLSTEIGVPFEFYRPNTSSLIDGDIIQLDSPLMLLLFSKLTIFERVRMGMVLAYLRYVADWKTLEGKKAHEWIPAQMGQRPYTMLWEPLLKTKFGSYYKDISLAWFWARIKARTTQLGYPVGGFQAFVDTLAKNVVEKGAKIHYQTGVSEIQKQGEYVSLKSLRGRSEKTHLFDRVICTVPNALFARLVPTLPADYKKKLLHFKGIGAVNMVLELDAPFLPNNVYWLNMCDPSYPFLAVVEHTNFVDSSHYNRKKLVYIGNYLPTTHRYFSLTERELLKEYDPYLRKICPDYYKSLRHVNIFKVPFAQPIVTQYFSKEVLPFKTPIEGLFLANMQQVYPWDRGTNFAVDLGNRVAREIVR